MYSYFIPNRLGRIVILLFALLVLFGSFTLAALAQDLATNTPIPEEPIAPADELPAELPDTEPVIDGATDELNEFLTTGKIVIALAAALLTQLLKWIWRNDPARREVNGQQIYMLVIAVLSTAYFIANLTGYVTQLQAGVAFLSVLADPLWQIIITLGGSSLVYLFGRSTGNVLLGGGYSSKAAHLEKPEPVNIIPGRVTSVELTALESPGLATVEDVQRMIDNSTRSIISSLRSVG